MDKRHIKQVVADVLIGVGGFWLQWLATGCVLVNHDGCKQRVEKEAQVCEAQDHGLIVKDYGCAGRAVADCIRTCSPRSATVDECWAWAGLERPK